MGVSATEGDGAETADSGTDSDGSDGDGEDDGERPWHGTLGGTALLVIDSVLLVAVAAGTTTLVAGWLTGLGDVTWPEAARVPLYVYGYGLLGALGYVFTTVVRESGRSASDLAGYNLRVFAALPLAGGIYLFADQLLGGGAPVRLVAGLAFVAGLFVNLTYERIGALADRLLPTEAELPDAPVRGGAGDGPDGGDDPGPAPRDQHHGGGADSGTEGGPPGDGTGGGTGVGEPAGPDGDGSARAGGDESTRAGGDGSARGDADGSRRPGSDGSAQPGSDGSDERADGT